LVDEGLGVDLGFAPGALFAFRIGGKGRGASSSSSPPKARAGLDLEVLVEVEARAFLGGGFLVPPREKENLGAGGADMNERSDWACKSRKEGRSGRIGQVLRDDRLEEISQPGSILSEANFYARQVLSVRLSTP
jgi:hypothetical protein